MGFFRRQLRGILFALLLSAVPLYFALKRPDIPSRGPIAWYDRTVLWIVSPVLKGIRFLQDTASGLFRHYIFLVRTEKENEKLRRSLQEIQWRGVFFESLSHENRRLTALISFREKLPYETIAARVLGYPPLGEFRLLTIDRGTVDGIKRGAAVVAPDGLVGRIIRTENNLAQVLLMTDPTSAVDARVQRTGARGLVVGRGQGIELDRELFIAAFEYWSGSQEVAEGDLLVTSGLDRSFPAEIPIGKARNLKKSGHDVFLKGEVIPAVDFHKLREVLVVKLP